MKPRLNLLWQKIQIIVQVEILEKILYNWIARKGGIMCKIKNASSVRKIAKNKESNRYGIEQIRYNAVSNRSPVF